MDAFVKSEARAIVVSFAVYAGFVRDFVASKLPNVEFVVLNDRIGATVKRKVQQVLDAAGQQPLSEYLGKFDSEYRPLTQEQCIARLHSKCSESQRGLEPARNGEVGIELGDLERVHEVVATVRSILKL
jgi:hypothetical protein